MAEKVVILYPVPIVFPHRKVRLILATTACEPGTDVGSILLQGDEKAADAVLEIMRTDPAMEVRRTAAMYLMFAAKAPMISLHRVTPPPSLVTSVALLRAGQRMP